MNPTPAAYAEAQRILWGDAGAWAAATFDRLNADYFAKEVPARGVVYGLTPHGHRLGHTEPTGRITLHPALLDPRSDAWGAREYLGPAYARDVLLHEMIHALLFARGVDDRTDDGSHNVGSWCEQVERLAPLLGLGTVRAAPVKPRRIAGKVTRAPLPGYLSRSAIARFPYTLRSPEWYQANVGRIPVRI